MKLEIRKDTKNNGDMFYHIYKDDMYLSDTSIYINSDPNGALKRIWDLYDKIKQEGQPEKQEVIFSEVIN